MKTPMEFGLSDKTILVTGASSGLGEAIAVACAESGARVVLVARNQQRLEDVRDKCAGHDHLVWPLDLTENIDALPKVMQAICKEVGPLSGLVHSAGIHQLKPLRILKSRDMESLFSLNTIVGVMLCKGLGLKGNHAPAASAVLLSSVMGRVGQPGAIAYSMSKGAVEAAVRPLALELMDQGIRVNCVAPAMIDTPMTAKAMQLLGPELSEKIQQQHPGGFGRPEDVAGAVVYLLSEASRYVTGTSLLVDGGYCSR